jgi:UBX domain-containing protein 1
MPRQFRETDLSTGVPRHRPVDIMLGDMRPQAYPAEALRRLGPSAGAPPPPTKQVRAFSGQGRTLADEGASSSSSTAAASSEPSLDAWPSAAMAAPLVDAAAPTTEVQVRVAGSGPQRLKLNRTHTVADLKCLLEGALEAAGLAPRAYTLSAGFPPKPLSDDSATLESVGLLNAAVTHRWV